MKRILIIGAGFLQAFVIEKAKKMGYYTLCVDGDDKAVGFRYADEYAVISITDQVKCLDYAKQKMIDGVLTAATDYGVLTASFISMKLNLPGLNYETAKLIKNKYMVRKCLYDHNVDDANQSYLVDEKTNIFELSKTVEFPVMVKPSDGSGSRGATRVDEEKELFLACQYAINNSLSRTAEIEKFIDGKEYGAESIVINGEVYVLAIMKKWMTAPPYYAELGHAIPNDLSTNIELKAKECVKTAIKVLGINHGCVNMDLIINSVGDVHIIDVGARMGGNMIGSYIIPNGTGIDYMAAMIQNSCGDFCSFKYNKKYSVSSRIIAFSKSGILKSPPDFEKICNDNKVQIFHHLIEGKEYKIYHTNLDGFGYIVSKQNSFDDANNCAETALKRIVGYYQDNEDGNR